MVQNLPITVLHISKNVATQGLEFINVLKSTKYHFVAKGSGDAQDGT
jgi:hypothetical protein